MPIVRLLYEIDPPIPGFLFSAFYFSISALTTISLSAFLDNRPQAEGGDNPPISESQDSDRVSAGIELGSWLFMGNTLQLLGLKTVPSDRAGFLVQCRFSLAVAAEMFVRRDTLTRCLIPLLQ